MRITINFGQIRNLLTYHYLLKYINVIQKFVPKDYIINPEGGRYTGDLLID